MATSLPLRPSVLHLLNRVVNAIAFWCVAALAILVTLGASGTQCNTKSKAYATAMKSDLRNLRTAQDAYHAAHGRYADAAALASGTLAFRGSTNIALTIEHADATGWRAIARTEWLPGATCLIDAGDESPHCEVPPLRRPVSITGNPTLDVAINLWLTAFSLGRRQRRLATARTSQALAPAI